MPPKKRSPLTELSAPDQPTADVHDLHPEQPAEDTSSRTPPAKARTVKVQSLYLKPAVHKQLQMIAVEEECKMHDLVLEGLDRVFQSRGRPSIKDLGQAKK